MNNKLNKIFKIISFYDDYRWNSSQNYNMINFFKKDLSPDVKIFTHWLCYITDRQMPFLRIWDIGGFVFSELIYEIKRQKSLNILNPESENSFVTRQIDDNKYAFISQTAAENNSIIANYDGVLQNGKVVFKSRFFPSDYVAMLYTFVFLEDYDFSFSKFIKEIYDRHKNTDDFIKRILFSLCLLTYDGIGQPKSSDLDDFANNIQKAKQNKIRVREILYNDNKFNNKFTKFLENQVFYQKRAWCSLRDFIKSPEFKKYFEASLREESLKDNDFDKLFSEDALIQLELPGDVWNNNSKFRKCILKNTEYEKSNDGLNKILREFFNKNRNNLIGYPEQFDITFDFVPRMCDKNNCDLCPIHKIENDSSCFDKICIKNQKMYCPVILAGCNYKSFCMGITQCKIL